MTRNVFSNDMVAHVWAQGRQDSGHSNNGNFYFSGRVLYSYGRHFVVGYLGPNNRALITLDSYSQSTPGHIGDARRAVTSPIYVPELTALVRHLPTYHDSKMDTAACLKACLAHVLKHASRFGTENATALLVLYGMAESKAGPRVASIMRKAARIAATKEAAEKKAEYLDNVKGAKNYAAMTDSAWREHVAAALRQTYVRTPWNWRRGGYDTKISGRLPGLARDLSRAKDAAKKSGATRVAGIVWSRLVAVRAMLKRPDLESMIERAKGNTGRRESIQIVRAAFEGWRAGRTMSGPRALEQFARHARNLARYAPSLAELATQANAAAAVRRAEIKAAAAAAREEARLERERSEAERRERWFAGLPSGAWGRDADGRAYIRAVGVERDAAGQIVAGTLETSQGADVPLTHAVKAFRFIKLCRDNGRDWHANGHCIRVGHFRVDSIDAAGNMVAGCHAFAWPEIERLAVELGVFDQAASDAALEPSNAAA